MISFCLPAGPTRAVRISGTSFSDRGDVKSENEGPVLRRSRKVVGGRRFVEVGGVADSVGSETAVANARVDDLVGRIGCIGTACKQRNRVALEAMLYLLLIEMESREIDLFVESAKIRLISNQQIGPSRVE